MPCSSRSLSAPIVALLTALSLLFAAPAKAQDWQPLDPAYGQGYATCASDTTGYLCLALACDPYFGAEFQFLSSTSEFAKHPEFLVRPDRGNWTLFETMRDAQPALYRAKREMDATSTFQHDQYYALLTALNAGAAQVEVIGSKSAVLPSRGAPFVISQIAQRCPFKNGHAESSDPRPMTTEELISKTNFPSIEEPETTEFDLVTGRTMQGSVLAVGSANRVQCADACRAEPRCQAFVHDDQNVCRLLERPSVLQPLPGSEIGVLARSADSPRTPRLPGYGPMLVPGLGPVQGEAADSYLTRLRAAAAPLGGDCAAEAAQIDALAQSLQLSALPQTVRAGKSVDLAWLASTGLQNRIPAWLMVSSDTPTRFSAEGGLALLPGAVAPFGLRLDQDRHRLLIPLFEGRSLTSGRIGLDFLQAGATGVNVSVVGWIRACQVSHEVPIQSIKAHILSGQSALVLPEFDWKKTAGGVTIPGFDRVLVFDGTNFELSIASDHTSLLTGTAKTLEVSPTGRFLAMHGQEFTEVIDVIDAKSILTMATTPVQWWNGDSFFSGSRFGATALQTAGIGPDPRLAKGEDPGQPDYTEKRGSSGCSRDDQSDVAIDLENGFLFLFDRICGVTSNHRVHALADGQYLGHVYGNTVDRQTTFDDFKHSTLGDHVRAQMFPEALSRIGLVAPIDPQRTIGFPPGPQLGTQIVAQGRPAGADTLALSAITPSEAPILRGANATARPVTASFQEALARVGLVLAKEDTGQILLAPTAVPSVPIDQMPQDVEQVRASLRSYLSGVFSFIPRDVQWSAQNTNPDEFRKGSRCSNANYHFTEIILWVDGQFADWRLPPEIDYLHRFHLSSGRTVFVERAGCMPEVALQEGSYGTLAILDTAKAHKTLASYIVDTSDPVALQEKPTVFPEPLTAPASLFAGDLRAKVVGDRYVLLWSQTLKTATVFDLQTREWELRMNELWNGNHLQDVFLDVRMKHLVQLNSDGGFAVYPLKTLARTDTGSPTLTEQTKPLLLGRYLDDEIVLWNDRFQYDSSAEGSAFVNLRFAGVSGQNSLDQLRADRRVPGLAEKTLVGAPLPNAPDIVAPPKMTAVFARYGSQVKGHADLVAPSEATELRLFVDGRLAQRVPFQGRTAMPIDLPLPPGARWATAVAVDAQGQSSRPVSTDLGRDPSGTLPRTHFLGVGIDRYSDPALPPLNYGKSDVLLLSNALGALDKNTIALISNTVIADRRATPEVILAQARAIVAAAQPGDHLVLHFAGHGLQDAKGGFYLAGPTTRLDDLAGTALAWSSLAQVFAGHDLRVTVLLDACHAGAATLGGNDGAVDTLRATMPPGLTVIAAAKGRQTSGEDPAVGGGLFSAAAAKVLGEARGQYDSNRNGVLEAVEFYRGVKTLVTARRGADQTPWLARNQAVGENGLF